MRLARIAAVLLVAVPLLAQSKEAGARLEEADALYDAGRFEQALTRYEEATKLDPKAADEERLLRLTFFPPAPPPPSGEAGSDAAERKRVQGRAVALLRRHLETHAPTEPVLLRYAMLLQDTGRVKEGLAWFDAARAHDPKNVPLIKGLLVLLGSGGERARITAALDDLARYATSAEGLHFGGVSAYEIVKRAPLDREARADFVRRGVAFERAALVKNQAFAEGMVYLSLLLREEAASATNASEAKGLTAEADALRDKAKAILITRQQSRALGDWSVEIVQDGAVAARVDAGMRRAVALLERRPFTIRVRIVKPVDILLNASITDDTANRVAAGFDFGRDCLPEETALFPCGPTTVAIEPKSTRIWTGAGKTNLLAADPQYELWTRTTRDGDDWVLERDVVAINMKPIASWNDALYLVLVLRTGTGPLTESDIRRVVISFL